MTEIKPAKDMLPTYVYAPSMTQIIEKGVLRGISPAEGVAEARRAGARGSLSPLFFLLCRFCQNVKMFLFYNQLVHGFDKVGWA